MGYWRSVLWLAIRESAEWSGMHGPRRLLRSILVFGIPAGLLWLLLPTSEVKDQVTEEVRIALALSGAAVITYLPVFLYKLATIPVPVDPEQRKLIERFQGRGDDVSQAIASLKADRVRTYRSDDLTDNDDCAFLLAAELADTLITKSIAPDEL